jgi:dTDP-4-amino-4,6-dideoxygalactose transaminase
MTFRIPFNKPALVGNEMRYVADAIARGHSAGDGAYTAKCHRFIQERMGAAGVLLTTSCTHALEMSALLLDLQPGDEVIVPAFTFVSTVNAYVLRGATPVFADIRPDTLNLDETKLERLITPRTKAIVVVHYAGVGCEMEAILAIADKHGITVIEDNAHGLFARYRGKLLGTFGAMATQSFHETKNVICGEGGALVVNDPAYHERAEIIREKGTNRSRFFRGQVDKYTWVDIGSSYLPSDILAAFLFAQLERYDEIQATRAGIWNRYDDALRSWAGRHGVFCPHIPADCEQAYHMYYILMPSLSVRQELIEHLKRHGILSVFHYLPLNLSDMGKKFGGRPGQCPVTEDVSDRLLRLPFYNDLGETLQAEVIEAIKSFSGWETKPTARRVYA